MIWSLKKQFHVDVFTIPHTMKVKTYFNFKKAWLLVLTGHLHHSPPLVFHSNLNPNEFLYPMPNPPTQPCLQHILPITPFKIKPRLRNRSRQLQSINQMQDPRDYNPIILVLNNCHSPIPTPNLSLMWRWKESLYAKPPTNSIFFKYQTPPYHQNFNIKLSPPEMLPRFQHLSLDSSNTHEWIFLTPPTSFLINKAIALQTPWSTITFQLV